MVPMGSQQHSGGGDGTNTGSTTGTNTSGNTSGGGRGRSSRSVWSALLGVVAVAVAAWFGWDLTGGSGDTTATSSAPSSAHSTGTASSQSSSPKPQGDSPRPDASRGAAPGGEHAQGTCPLAQLPPQAAQVAKAIVNGGPFAHPNNDGTRFGNYESALPRQGRDYYREYTVDTPGAGHRGARRIVTGGPSPTQPEVWYYTADHYESFCEIPDAP